MNVIALLIALAIAGTLGAILWFTVGANRNTLGRIASVAVFILVVVVVYLATKDNVGVSAAVQWTRNAFGRWERADLPGQYTQDASGVFHRYDPTAPVTSTVGLGLSGIDVSATQTALAMPPVQPTQAAASPRRETKNAPGDQLKFSAGDSAFGSRIILDNNEYCDSCYVQNAPVPGTVYGGVVGDLPDQQEITEQGLVPMAANGGTPAGRANGANGGGVSTPQPPQQPQVPANQNPPYDLPPQPQIGHPSFYAETGVPDPVGVNEGRNTKRWDIDLLPGTVAIIGGFTVDGVSDGVYKAVAGGRVNTLVTDGFIAITKQEWANAEFCFRLSQAIEFGWAHNTVQPLAGWTACDQQPMGQQPAPQAAPQQGQQQPQAAGQRRPSGTNQTIRFNAGEAVFGWKFKLDNGDDCDGGNCYIASAPSGGSVTSGVVNPWPEEVKGLPEWKP